MMRILTVVAFADGTSLMLMPVYDQLVPIEPSGENDPSPILPCPCCGGKAMFVYPDTRIECLSCHLSTAEHEDLYSCLEAWNRRDGE